MNWDDVRIFLAAARAGSLSGAGQILRMDPATVGRRIARLERDRSEALFVKSAKGYRLTQAGEALLPQATAMEDAGRAMTSGDPGSGLAGTIRIGAAEGCANYLLPPLMAHIAQAHPDISLQVVALPRVLDLTSREADLAITVSPQTGARIQCTQIAPYQLHLAASQDYLARHAPITKPADLQGHDMVGYIPDMLFDLDLDYLTELGLSAPRIASNSSTVQVGLLRDGAGLGVVHDFMLAAHPELVKVLPEQISFQRAYHLIQRADAMRNQTERIVARYILDGLPELIAQAEA